MRGQLWLFARRNRARRRSPFSGRWLVLGRVVVEAGGLLIIALIGVLTLLGQLADRFAGTNLWSHLLPFAGAILALGVSTALLLRGWLAVRGWLERRLVVLPMLAATVGALVALRFATGPSFQREVGNLGALIGGPEQAERAAIAHQVFASYRRADLKDILRVMERGRVYEPTVYEAAAAFDVDPEVLMGVGAAESSFHPRDSADGGRGLFQITVPPKEAVAAARSGLGTNELDPLNQRHNAFVAAATLRRYLDQMDGDFFLGLLAYNIGPRNGGLLSIMRQYGARDFVTIQPYLQKLPRDYPIRVLTLALGYRLWHNEGRLPRYEEGSNAHRIQRIGIPGLSPTLRRAGVNGSQSLAQGGR